MIVKNKMYSVKNRCPWICVYTIPSMHIERTFAPGQEMRISGEEIERLSYEKGGINMILQYLQIQDPDAFEGYDQLNIEQEYHMSEKDVVNALLNYSIDEFSDVLDFAPPGVIDLIKTKAVELPLNDAQKRKIIKDMTGFDVDAAIRHNQEDKNEAEQEGVATEIPKKTRRVSNSSSSTGRRSAPKQYEVVDKNK